MALAVAGLALLVVACGRDDVMLGMAPNLYHAAGSYPATEVAPYLRTDQPTLFYVTDRNPIDLGGGNVSYGHERSSSMVFGASVVQIGAGRGWESLAQASTQNANGGELDLKVLQSREIVRFSPTPLRFEVRGGQPETLAPDRQIYEQQTRAFQAAVTAELRQAARKEVVVFVHGFRNDFVEAEASLASIWHYSGRIGVPILYTWPAGNPGMFGYFKDRESGEFSIYHLKEFLRMLAAIPELEHITIIAHSRGSDVTTSALREMVIAERAAGRVPLATLKIRNLILAAPDLDFGVMRQRLIAERFGAAFGQVTVYLNPNDKSLGLAQRLMAGIRLGRISFDDLGESERESFRRIRNVNFVDVEKVVLRQGHSYFRDNPSVVSDIVLVLRTNARPGTAERPLDQLDFNFWSMHPGYPLARPKPAPPPVAHEKHD